MASRDIVIFGDPVLRTPAREVSAFDEELEALVRDLFETMYVEEGIGLAAPQVGVGLRVAVVDLRPHGEADKRVALVNPRVVWSSHVTERHPEGCLSLPGLEEVVERPRQVRVEALDPDGQPLVIEAEDLYARALQHEIDHLDGMLFLDRVSPLKRRMLLKKWRKLQAEPAT